MSELWFWSITCKSTSLSLSCITCRRALIEVNQPAVVLINLDSIRPCWCLLWQLSPGALLHPWKHSQPGWMRLWAMWSSWRCSCSLQEGWNILLGHVKIPSNPNQPILCFYDLQQVWEPSWVKEKPCFRKMPCRSSKEQAMGRRCFEYVRVGDSMASAEHDPSSSW